MFSFFKTDKSESYPVRDMVWKASETAIKGMLMMAMRLLQQEKSAIILTFFEEDKNELIKFLQGNSIVFNVLNATCHIESPAAPKIYLVEYQDMQSAAVIDLVTKNFYLFGKAVFFPCHYPVISEENKTLRQLSRVGFSEFVFCLSFDDPMLDSLKGNIMPLLEKLGLEENESIEHAFVTSALKNVRKKISQKVKVEKKTPSAKEWYVINLKS